MDLATRSLEVEGEEAFVREVYLDFKEMLKSQKSTAEEAPAPTDQGANEAGGGSPPAGPGGFLASYTTLGECLAGAKTTVDTTKVLLASAFLQVNSNLEELSGGFVNKELKHTGHGVSNITAAMEANIAHKPAYIIQLRKSGSTKQARKKYKVTGEGIAEVQRMLTQSASTTAQ
jgi:hypothetical protein